MRLIFSESELKMKDVECEEHPIILLRLQISATTIFTFWVILSHACFLFLPVSASAPVCLFVIHSISLYLSLSLFIYIYSLLLACYLRNSFTLNRFCFWWFFYLSSSFLPSFTLALSFYFSFCFSFSFYLSLSHSLCSFSSNHSFFSYLCRRRFLPDFVSRQEMFDLSLVFFPLRCKMLICEQQLQKRLEPILRRNSVLTVVHLLCSSQHNSRA